VRSCPVGVLLRPPVRFLNLLTANRFLSTPVHFGAAFCLFPSSEPAPEALLERYGFPEAGMETRCYTNHALSYDQAKRVPRWVIEHISKQKTLGT
uniref:Uncharacterized protein n=1 Tax=Nothoprocta perdicaria TaxID=30464 RepID=A0A8C6ZEY4_NOTPE